MGWVESDSNKYLNELDAPHKPIDFIYEPERIDDAIISDFIDIADSGEVTEKMLELDKETFIDEFVNEATYQSIVESFIKKNRLFRSIFISELEEAEKRVWS